MDENKPGLISRLSAFAAHPFKADGDAISWALFTVFVVTIAVFWTRILAHIVEE